MCRRESGNVVSAIVAAASRTIMSISLMLPPLFWCVAALTPDRPAEVTSIVHELAVLTLATTDQYFIFCRSGWP
jgi:hypothetical protein